MKYSLVNMPRRFSTISVIFRYVFVKSLPASLLIGLFYPSQFLIALNKKILDNPCSLRARGPREACCRRPSRMLYRVTKR